MQKPVKEKISTLSSALTLGSVELNVENLPEMKKFYHSTLGLDILEETSDNVTLGKNKMPLVILHKISDLPKQNPTHAGLYHFAILYSSRGDLARTVYKILKEDTRFFSGSADHLVSEAFYFNDPEGNGIELYYDRERSLWQWENNHIKMATMYIDPADYLERYAILKEPNSKVGMGHYHLKVGDIENARSFYVDILGFDITAELPQALFISVGGYHHHIGLNTWESNGAGKRTSSYGLKRLEFFLSSNEDLHSLKDRLTKNEIEYSEENNSLKLHDPWHNELVIKTL